MTSSENNDPSTGTGSSFPQNQQPMDKKTARSNAAAAKAYQKGQRSWFMRHKILSAIGVVVVIAVAATALNKSDPAPTSQNAVSAAGASPSTSAAATEQPAQDAPGIGSPVNDGDFEFTVTAVDPGVPVIGTEPVTTKAQGQFVLVHVTVKNNGSSQTYFDVSAQKMFDQQGRELSPNVGAAIYVDPSNVLTQINPGNSVTGIMVYDIPVDAVPTSLEVHDSAFSAGTTISLG